MKDGPTRAGGRRDGRARRVENIPRDALQAILGMMIKARKVSREMDV
jgi:hypothetical protein